MCRYALSGPYKRHFACFFCRKVFRESYAIQGAPASERAHPCPECQHPMQDMGKDFKAPKQTDVRQWKKVEILLSRGISFHSCGCGTGYRPATLSEIEPFFREIDQRNEDEERIRYNQNKEKRHQEKATRRRARRNGEQFPRPFRY